MRIGVISKDDERGGGASVVAAQLTRVYRQLGHEATHISLRGRGETNPFGSAWAAHKLVKRIEGKLGWRDHNAWELTSHAFRRLPHRFDSFHLHDMSTVLSHTGIGWLAGQRPTLWTVHDCSPFTAGCLYPGSCVGFESTCGQCPQVRSWPIGGLFDRTSQLHGRRRRVLASPVRFTAPSHWMIRQYLRSGWPAGRISYIPNGVDLSVFRPIDRTAARQTHGQADHAGPLLLFSSGWLHDARKGPGYVRMLMERLKHLNPRLVLVGRYSDEAASLFRGLDVAHFGFVKSDADRASIYGMCDATLTFSTEENAPLIAIESLACGTPILGFAAGGLAEIVPGRDCGFLASVGDIDAVTMAANKLLSSEMSSTRRACAARATAHHDYRVIGQAFLSLLFGQERLSVPRAVVAASHVQL